MFQGPKRSCIRAIYWLAKDGGTNQGSDSIKSFTTKPLAAVNADRTRTNPLYMTAVYVPMRAAYVTHLFISGCCSHDDAALIPFTRRFLVQSKLIVDAGSVNIVTSQPEIVSSDLPNVTQEGRWTASHSWQNHPNSAHSCLPFKVQGPIAICIFLCMLWKSHDDPRWFDHTTTLI